MGLMAGVKNKKNNEPHIPKPFQKGNDVIREYTEDKIVNGTIYRSVLVDYVYTKKDGTKAVEYGYPLRHTTIRTPDSHLTVSDLNQMSVLDITLHMEYILKDEYKYLSKQYFMFISKYLQRRLTQNIHNLQVYDDIARFEKDAKN